MHTFNKGKLNDENLSVITKSLLLKAHRYIFDIAFELMDNLRFPIGKKNSFTFAINVNSISNYSKQHGYKHSFVIRGFLCYGIGKIIPKFTFTQNNPISFTLMNKNTKLF